MKLLVATRNPGKLREIRDLLSSSGVEVQALADRPAAPEVDEDGQTFLENARKKARTLSEQTGLPTLADDSGLVVDALQGRPGIRSARFAGPGASDEDNNRRLLRDLSGVAPDARGAAFVCAMAFVLPDGREATSEGRLEGRILEAPRGTRGFGYDPLFLVAGADQTLAEMALESKNRLSHRSLALRALLPHILSAAAE